MKERQFVPAVLLIALAALTFAAGYAKSQESSSPGGVPAHLVVTAEARHGSQVPVIKREDVQVYQGRERVQVADWIRLTGEHAGLQLFLLIDDAADSSLGSQIEDLRRFISSQPATTAIGVGYMRNGTVQIVQNLTNDHAAAAKAVRLPTGNGGAFGSIYLSISDLIKGWPESPIRRELIVVSDGVDPYGGMGPSNPYAESAIEQAQQAGIIIYTIYTPGEGSLGYWSRTWGQNHLSQLAEETGGAAFYLGYEAPVTFKPYLDQISRRLANQYLLTFLAKPERKAGLQRVRVRTEVPNVQLIAAPRVYVPAVP